jgi:UDP-N-acetylglucosamine 2-epimerase (non-hydrolysing)
MKVAPLYHELAQHGWCRPQIVHTGQHYDANMSDAFFRDLSLPEPAHHLEIGSGSHAEQTGRTMIAYEAVCERQRPDAIVVVGDVNATAACALVGTKLWIPVVHLEAGLRSRDRVPAGKIERIGNIMIDSFEMLRAKIEATNAQQRLKLKGAFALVTLHRPSNVDQRDTLSELARSLVEVSRELTVVFAMHPRTRKRLEEFALMDSIAAASGITTTEPLSYLEFMNLVMRCTIAITDSGGVQEETTYLGIPCATLRENTERPITVTQGTNRLMKAADLVSAARSALAGTWPRGARPHGWDGRARERAGLSLGRLLGAL